MKIKYLVILSTLILFYSCNNILSQFDKTISTDEVEFNPVVKLSVKDLNIINLLDTLNNTVLENIHSDENIYIIKIDSLNQMLQLEFSIYVWNDFPDCLTKHTNKHVGYFNYKKNTVLVFGSNFEPMFEELSQKVTLSYLKYVPRDPSKIEYGHWEPSVFVYDYMNGILIYKDEYLGNIFD